MSRQILPAVLLQQPCKTSWNYEGMSRTWSAKILLLEIVCKKVPACLWLHKVVADPSSYREKNPLIFIGTENIWPDSCQEAINLEALEVTLAKSVFRIVLYFKNRDPFHIAGASMIPHPGHVQGYTRVCFAGLDQNCHPDFPKPLISFQFQNGKTPVAVG